MLYEHKKRPRAIPVSIYVLGFAIFAQGTSECLLSGLMPTLSRELHVSLAEAGLLVSAFALGMVVGAPLLALITLRMPRPAALAVFQIVFVTGHIAAALTPEFTFLLTMRAITGMAYAGFWTVASVTAVSLVRFDQRGRAMSVVVSGISIATILGVPAGTYLGQNAGWQAAFWAVAAASTVAAVALAFALPRRSGGSTERLQIRAELRSLSTPLLWVNYATTTLTIAAVFAIFTYLGALLEEVANVPTELVPLMLGLYGVGALVGLMAGGRTSDSAPWGTLLTGMGIITVAAPVLAHTASNAAVAIPLLVIIGAAGSLTNPAVNARVFSTLGEAKTLGGALNIAAFNVGIAVAPWVAGRFIDTGAGLTATAWVGGAFAAAAVGSSLLDRHLSRNPVAPRASKDSVLQTAHNSPQ